jgi:hypothetical protein
MYICLDLQYSESKRDYNFQISVFWFVTEIILVDGYGTDFSEGYSVSIFTADEEGSMLLLNVGIHLEVYKVSQSTDYNLLI